MGPLVLCRDGKQDLVASESANQLKPYRQPAACRSAGNARAGESAGIGEGGEDGMSPDAHRVAVYGFGFQIALNAYSINPLASRLPATRSGMSWALAVPPSRAQPTDKARSFRMMFLLQFPWL